jgi:hypothetical protein
MSRDREAMLGEIRAMRTMRADARRADLSEDDKPGDPIGNGQVPRWVDELAKRIIEQGEVIDRLRDSLKLVLRHDVVSRAPDDVTAAPSGSALSDTLMELCARAATNNARLVELIASLDL